MERYLEVHCTNKVGLLEKGCSLLEDNGIPIIIEHLQQEDRRSASSWESSLYRVLVPSGYRQRASRLMLSLREQ